MIRRLCWLGWVFGQHALDLPGDGGRVRPHVPLAWGVWGPREPVRVQAGRLGHGVSRGRPGAPICARRAIVVIARHPHVETGMRPRRAWHTRNTAATWVPLHLSPRDPQEDQASSTESSTRPSNFNVCRKHSGSCSNVGFESEARDGPGLPASLWLQGDVAADGPLAPL